MGSSPIIHSLNPARTHLSSKEHRLASSTTAWMTLLGRGQMLSGALSVGTLIFTSLLVALADAFTPQETAPEFDQPALVVIGDVEPLLVWTGAALLVLVAFLLFRGGMLLVGAARSFERLLSSDDIPSHHLEVAFTRLRKYCVTEALLLLVVGVIVLAAGAL